MLHAHLDYFQQLPFGGRPNTKPGDHGTPNAHHRWFILFYHTWGPAWTKIHWNSIWLRVQYDMPSHYTRGSVTTLHDVGGVLGRPLDTFFWALTMSWSRLFARVWSGPRCGRVLKEYWEFDTTSQYTQAIRPSSLSERRTGRSHASDTCKCPAMDRIPTTRVSGSVASHNPKATIRIPSHIVNPLSTSLIIFSINQCSYWTSYGFATCHMMNDTQAEYIQNIRETEGNRSIMPNKLLASQCIDTQPCNIMLRLWH